MLGRFGGFRVDHCGLISLIGVLIFFTLPAMLVYLLACIASLVIESLNGWKGHSKPISFQVWAGPFSTRPGCPKLHPARP